jgi:excisionase family DNA binding protein
VIGDDCRLSLDQAAVFLAIHPNTLRRHVHAGLIPGGKLGRDWRFLKSDLVTLDSRGLICALTDA